MITFDLRDGEVVQEGRSMAISFGDRAYTLNLTADILSAIATIDKYYKLYTCSNEDDVSENFYTNQLDNINLSSIDSVRELLVEKESTDSAWEHVNTYDRASKYLGSLSPKGVTVEVADRLQDILSDYQGINVGKGYRLEDKSCHYSASIQKVYPEVFKKFTGIPIVDAALLHYFMVWLLPYRCENWRSARLLMRQSLVSAGYSEFAYADLSRYIYQAKEDYYKCACPALRSGGITPFVAFVVSCILKLVMQESKDV